MLYATNRMQSGSNHLKLRRLKCKEKKKEYNCTLASSTSIDHFQAVAKITDRDGYRFYQENLWNGKIFLIDALTRGERMERHHRPTSAHTPDMMTQDKKKTKASIKNIAKMFIKRSINIDL